MRAEERLFELESGSLALDFANTLGDRFEPTPAETLFTYHDLIAFARQAGVVSRSDAERLHELANRRPLEAKAMLARATSLRETIFHVMSAIADGKQPDADDLDILNCAVTDALQHGCIVPGPGGFRWAWQETPYALDRVLWPIAHAALELLTHGELDRLRMCAADDCGWLFIDTTRNKSRKWCDMKTCGNRAKVSRFRDKHEHREETA